jgi:hypothetical protein
MSEGENNIPYQGEFLSSQRSLDVRIPNTPISSIEAQQMANRDHVVVIRKEDDGVIVYIPYDIFSSEINLTHSTNIVAEDLKDYTDKDLEELRTNPESEEIHEDFSEDESNERFSNFSYCLVFDPDCPVMQQMAEKYSIPFKQMLGHERGMIYLPHDWLQDYCGIYELPRGIDKNSVTVITQNNSSMTVEISIPDQTYNGRFHYCLDNEMVDASQQMKVQTLMESLKTGKRSTIERVWREGRVKAIPIADQILAVIVAERSLLDAGTDVFNQPPLPPELLESDVAAARAIHHVGLSEMQAVTMNEWDEELYLANRFARLFGFHHAVFYRGEHQERFILNDLPYIPLNSQESAFVLVGRAAIQMMRQQNQELYDALISALMPSINNQALQGHGIDALVSDLVSCRVMEPSFFHMASSETSSAFQRESTALRASERLMRKMQEASSGQQTYASDLVTSSTAFDVIDRFLFEYVDKKAGV